MQVARYQDLGEIGAGRDRLRVPSAPAVNGTYYEMSGR